jgi:hypothetical protein
MIDANSRAFAETVFQREPTREKEIKDALKMEAERQEAVVKNMHRLRALRCNATTNRRSVNRVQVSLALDQSGRLGGPALARRAEFVALR